MESIKRRLNIYNSYKECRNLFKKHSKSYYLGAMLFPFKKFKHITAFYGLVRVADDIVDNFDYCKDNKKYKLEEFINNFFYIFSLNDKDYNLIKNDDLFWSKYHVIFRALFITIKELQLDKSLFERFFNSMKMDLEIENYKTYEDLEKYMDGSAAVVGEIMLKIMSHDDKYYLENINNNRIYHSRILGNAFQLTNFIRDVKEDYNMNPRRIYLPTDELDNYNINLDDYNNTQIINDNFKFFIKDQIKKNNDLYKISDVGINMLSPNDSLAIKLSRILYSRILDKIEEKNYELFSPQKIKVSFNEKMYIIYDNIGFIKFIKIIINYILYSYFFILMFI